MYMKFGRNLLVILSTKEGTYTQTKKETSDFHGTVSLDPVKMLQQK